MTQIDSKTRQITFINQKLINSNLKAQKQMADHQFQKIDMNNDVQTDQNMERQGMEQSKIQLITSSKSKQSSCQKYHFIFYFVIICILIGVGLVLLLVLLNNTSNEDKSNINPVLPDKTAEYYELVTLNSSTALCLDGSPAAYDLSKGGDPSKVLLFFRQGAWCVDKDYQTTLQSCYNRSKTWTGSSKTLKKQFKAYAGIISRHQRNYFKDWKKVILYYCDGMGHQGTRLQPIQYNGSLLYFRGHNITIERLDSLQEKIGLFSNATQIVVSGESAGGLASLQWINYIADRAQKAKVFGISSSGIFYDAYNFEKQNFYYKEMFKSIVNLTNLEIDPPIPECVQQFPNNKQNCHFVQHIYKYIKVPVFFVQSLYDTWSIYDVIGIKCTELFFEKLNTCNSSQMQKIEEYKTFVYNLLDQMSKKNGNGVWGLACPAHLIFLNDKLYSSKFAIPESSSNTISEVIKKWMQNITTSNIYLDKTKWPQNFACSNFN